MKIQVEQVAIPIGSTIGFGAGKPVGDETKLVIFAGDWRPMAGLGETIAGADEPVVIDVADSAVLEIIELPQRR